ncbi:hypothetical protein V5097_07840 [Arenibacter palladensis]|uniref:hypothetical protein n=1 Tax=Arenibacter palladensis TaxID=237373 RepID=UPI002FCF3249
MKYIAVIFFFLSYLWLSGQNVYTTKTGEKYHKETCHYLKNSQIKIDVAKALERGYTACKVCKPSVKQTTQINSTNSVTSPGHTVKSKPTTNSKQCTGKTKAGSRCKRITKNSNGRCYQHQ